MVFNPKLVSLFANTGVNHASRRCEEEGAVLDATDLAVNDLLKEGYAPESIAVLSFRGVSSSKLFNDDIANLGQLPIKKFIGYTDKGVPNWTNGKLFLDSLFRFKGQCADAVVLTEVDFSEWDENTKRRLFVGLSRDSPMP